MMRPLLFLLGLVGCASAVDHPVPTLVPEAHTIATRFAPPAGFTRDTVEATSFGAYLRALPLQPAGSPVHLYNGDLKGRQDVQAAVIDLSVGRTDLQQCADAVMRLRAEHLFAQGRFSDIHFNFTSGFRADFSRWANGERIRVQGNTCTWSAGAARASRTHADLIDFLQQVFTYAGSLSLSKELHAPAGDRYAPGDVFIHGGSPGHAMVVVDVAHDAQGRQVFLLAQSYMPAQEVHIVRNPRRPDLGAWFLANDDDALHTPEWTFPWDERKSW